jgi:hypothetical protein
MSNWNRTTQKKRREYIDFFKATLNNPMGCIEAVLKVALADPQNRTRMTELERIEYMATNVRMYGRLALPERVLQVRAMTDLLSEVDVHLAAATDNKKPYQMTLLLAKAITVGQLCVASVLDWTDWIPTSAQVALLEGFRSGSKQPNTTIDRMSYTKTDVGSEYDKGVSTGRWYHRIVQRNPSLLDT